MLARLAPVLFVLIWSTGFIVARAMTPHAAPELVLLARMALTTAVLGGVAAMTGQAWPAPRRLGLHLVAGALLNGAYLCLSWWAVARGMPAGVMSLLGASQPLIVAVLSFLLLRERLPVQGWSGLVIGMAGVALVLTPLLGRALGHPLPLAVAAAAIASIIAMALGTLVQRSGLAKDGMAVSAAIQNAGGTAVALLSTLAVGDYRWDNSLPLWAGLGWSVLLLSAGALSLLVWMTRRQGATRVSLLLLLVPPIAAVEAAALFGERLTPLQLVGFAMALGGVVWARQGPKRSSRPG